MHATGPVEYHRDDLIRMAVFVALAEVYEQPMKLVEANLGAMTAFVAGVQNADNQYGEPIVLQAPSCAVELKPALVKALRERLAQVAV